MIFGNLWQDSSYPPSIEINSTLRKMRFFLGDRWLEIGEAKFITVVEKGRMFIRIDLPNVEAFLIQGEVQDNGTLDWYGWGPRVN